MKTIEQYAHDYRDMAMSQEDLRKMLYTLGRKMFEEGVRIALSGAGVEPDQRDLDGYWAQFTC